MRFDNGPLIQYTALAIWGACVFYTWEGGGKGTIFTGSKPVPV